MQQQFTHLIFKRDFSDKAPKTEFDLKELEIHKGQSFAEGYEAGKRESEAELRMILARIAQDIETSLRANEKMLSYSISIAEKVCTTLFPKFSQEGALLEARGAVDVIFQKLHEECVYNISCAAPIKDALEEHLKMFDSRFKFNVESHHNFSGSDLHIQWNNGFVWRNEVELLEQITNILASYKETT